MDETDVREKAMTNSGVNFWKPPAITMGGRLVSLWLYTENKLWD
jgi:hypothetical protein